MSVSIHVTKRLGALRPIDAQSEEVLRDIPDGATLKAEITRPSQRSVQHHRLFFAMLGIVAEHMGWTTDQALTWTKVATGHVYILEDRTGQRLPHPKSISFAKMSQSDFREFFDRAAAAILDRLLPPGTPRSDLMEEIEERAALANRRAA